MRAWSGGVVIARPAVVLCAVVLSAVVSGAVPALAHETAPSIVPVIDGFAPEVGGVEAFVQASQDATLLTLQPDAGVEVEVLDADGTAWARVTATEVAVDVTNPAYHAGLSPGGAVPDPLPDPEEPWVVVAHDGRLQWFEHRLHPAGLEVDPAVLSGRTAQDVASWSVQLRVDGAQVELRGRLRHVPVTGRLEPRLLVDRELAPGVVVEVVAGAVPAFFLRNTSSQSVTVLSPDGSPYVVIDETGARVNLASSTWAEQRRFEGRGGGPAEAPTGPAFEQLSTTPAHTWLDSRAALPGVVPDETVRTSDRETTVLQWSIPIEVGGELVAVEGVSVWVPLGIEEGEAEGAAGSWTAMVRAVPLEYVVAGLVALALLVVWLRRRG